MIVALDVHYEGDSAHVGGVRMRRWTDAIPESERRLTVAGVAPYEPGAFFRRELPPLLAWLAEEARRPETLVIDGYVWLGPARPGLGARMFEALGGRVPVIGVAKSLYRGAETVAEPVRRGISARPLSVTAVGLAVGDAADHVRAMHGSHRLPTLLARADAVARGRSEA